MSGVFTPGLPVGGPFTGNETFPFDANLSSGASPESAAISAVQLAAAMAYFSNYSSVSPGASGYRYYSSYQLGSSVVTVPRLITGIAVLIGSTGGTDRWIMELHDASGNLLANSATAGVTVGTAGAWQQFPFTTAYQAYQGAYFLTLQSNGTTAKFAAYNSPTSPLLTGDTAAGTFGTGAAFTAPTTYTQAVGPVALPYT